jgi:hypothetical protein
MPCGRAGKTSIAERGFLWNEGAGIPFLSNGMWVCPFRLHRTIFRRFIHNIYSSCHVDVTYIIDKGPKSPEQWNRAH